jgi:hypothetical protein
MFRHDFTSTECVVSLPMGLLPIGMNGKGPAQFGATMGSWEEEDFAYSRASM